jgi:hypothetical protein
MVFPRGLVAGPFNPAIGLTQSPKPLTQLVNSASPSPGGRLLTTVLGLLELRLKFSIFREKNINQSFLK